MTRTEILRRDWRDYGVAAIALWAFCVFWTAAASWLITAIVSFNVKISVGARMLNIMEVSATVVLLTVGALFMIASRRENGARSDACFEITLRSILLNPVYYLTLAAYFLVFWAINFLITTARRIRDNRELLTEISVTSISVGSALGFWFGVAGYLIKPALGLELALLGAFGGAMLVLLAVDEYYRDEKNLLLVLDKFYLRSCFFSPLYWITLVLDVVFSGRQQGGHSD